MNRIGFARTPCTESGTRRKERTTFSLVVEGGGAKKALKHKHPSLGHKGKGFARENAPLCDAPWCLHVLFLQALSNLLLLIAGGTRPIPALSGFWGASFQELQESH